MKTSLQKLSITLNRWLGLATPGVACSSDPKPLALRAAVPLDKLRLKAMSDHLHIERLMAFEVRRSPELARAEAIRQANECWERDLMA
jgi:hypothetical protein